LTPTATALKALDAAHYLSAGAVGFARGVNDTPKRLALLLPAQVLPTGFAIALLAAVMAIGGLLAASRVAETMSHRVTTMTPSQGFVANVMTALLVLFASRVGLPVSTTHVTIRLANRTRCHHRTGSMANHRPNRSRLGCDIAVRYRLRRVGVVVFELGGLDRPRHRTPNACDWSQRWCLGPY
jgi:phosphate transporter family protein